MSVRYNNSWLELEKVDLISCLHADKTDKATFMNRKVKNNSPCNRWPKRWHSWKIMRELDSSEQVVWPAWCYSGKIFSIFFHYYYFCVLLVLISKCLCCYYCGYFPVFYVEAAKDKKPFALFAQEFLKFPSLDVVFGAFGQ